MACILIIEDDRSIALGLRLNLRKDGHEVRIAQDGETGLRMALEPDVDLIVLDVMLPVRNGFEVLKEARRQGMDLVGIYHSHPDCDAYFSKTDLENSCPWYSFIVLSIQKGEFDHANSWLPNAEQTKAEKEELIYA